jgi:putative peptidoglycan lipid II flippase
MLRNLLTVSSGTLASRLLGFVRDAMMAALLGAGPIADAFLVAFQMVNVVRRLLTEGALNAALVPAWLRVNGEQGAVAAAAFAGRVLGTISLAVAVVAGLIGFAMPLVIALLAPGFVGSDTLGLAVQDARLMLPYLAFAGPVTVMMALLNAQHRFALTAFSPLLFNLALIGVMAALLLRPIDASRAAVTIAATVGIAGLLQLATLVLSGRAGSVATPLRLSVDAPTRALLRRALPGMVASSGPQLLIVAGAIVASRSPAAVSWLYFANRLIELPLGIVGSALGTVLVPEMTRALRGDDGTALVHAQSRGFELGVGLALPATLGLIVLAQPIVRVLFEHGAFAPDDTAATAQALMALALGLPAHVLTKALAPAFFAREDTMTPLIATLCGLGVAVVAAMMSPSATGIAGAIAGGAWASAVVLVVGAVTTFGVALDAAAARHLPRIVLAAMVMGTLLWLTTRYVWPLASEAHTLTQALVLGGLIAGGLAVYGAMLALTGVLDLTAIRRRLRR